jgi:hypothetical protein
MNGAYRTNFKDEKGVNILVEKMARKENFLEDTCVRQTA